MSRSSKEMAKVTKFRGGSLPSITGVKKIVRYIEAFDKRVVISRFHCSVAIQGIMLHISFPTYIQYTVLSTRNFIPNSLNKRTSLLQACTFIQCEAKTEPVKAVISMPPLISSQKVMLLIGHNTINASCLSYLTFSIL